MCILACGWQEASWWSVITQVICWRVYNGILGRNTSRSPSSSVQPSMFSSVLFPCSLTFNFIARTVLSNCFCCRERRWERDSFCLPFFSLIYRTFPTSRGRSRTRYRRKAGPHLPHLFPVLPLSGRYELPLTCRFHNVISVKTIFYLYTSVERGTCWTPGNMLCLCATCCRDASRRNSARAASQKKGGGAGRFQRRLLPAEQRLQRRTSGGTSRSASYSPATRCSTGLGTPMPWRGPWQLRKM